MNEKRNDKEQTLFDIQIYYIIKRNDLESGTAGLRYLFEISVTSVQKHL